MSLKTLLTPRSTVDKRNGRRRYAFADTPNINPTHNMVADEVRRTSRASAMPRASSAMAAACPSARVWHASTSRLWAEMGATMTNLLWAERHTTLMLSAQPEKRSLAGVLCWPRCHVARL